MNFNESKTKQNLAWAFAAECQAGARYQFIATQAQMSKMFYLKDTLKMLAKNEMAHAKLYYDYIIEKCGEEFKVEYDANYPYVCLDLQKSLVGEKNIERDEFERIYPKFACIAREEGCRFTFGSDAHGIRQYQYLPLAERVAALSGITGEDMHNIP